MRRFLLFGFVLNLIGGCTNLVNDMVNDKFLEIDKDLRVNIELNKDSAQVILRENEDIKELKEIENLTAEIDQYIEKFRTDLITHLSAEYNGKKFDLGDFEKQMEYTIGDNKQGEGYNLEMRLRKYINKINSISNKFTFEHIAKDGSDIDIFIGTENAKKDFVTLFFEGNTAVGALAFLSQCHLEVIDVELAAIKLLVKEK